MKKNFTLILMSLFLLVGGVNAQNYRKWDFTKWSATTIANLAAEAAAGGVKEGSWSDVEKADSSINASLHGACFWSYGESNVVNGSLSANGATIEETEGLVFNSAYAAKRSLAIAVNYPSTSLGTYAGPTYLWLGGGNASKATDRIACFTIPKVRIGQKITIVAESHKPAEGRGVSLFVKAVTDDANQIGESFKPKEQASYTWEDWTAEDEDGDGTVDILVYNTNGCHIYSIEIGDSDQKSKIAYLYQGATDVALEVTQGIANYEVEAIDVAATSITAEQLQNYDAVVVAANIATDNAMVATIKEAISWTPIVNMNGSLYDVWGYGESMLTEAWVLLVSDTKHELVKGIELEEEEEGMVLPIGGNVTGISLGDYFKNDAVPANPYEFEELVGIHIHNSDHNCYVYIPFTDEPSDEAKQLLINAIKAAANSKAAVTAAPKPVISLDYKNMNTDVTITSNVVGAQVFYTTDGSEPTASSTPYTGTFNVTTECTVKAVAKGDGYTLSEVAEAKVVMKEQLATPTISIEKAEKKATVTIKGEGTIWYNYVNANDTAKSAKYTEPLVLEKNRNVYAFSTQEDKVNSDLAVAYVEIDGYQQRIDILTHMDANSTEYNGGSTSTAYFFSWGKNKSGENGYPFYNVEAGYTEEETFDETTGETITVKKYNEMNPEEEKDFGTDWMVRARGQLVIWENQTTGTNYGNSEGYNFASVEDNDPYFPTTKAYINLADKNTEPSDASFPYNAYIVTTKPFKGPFDIVINAASITKPDSPGTHAVVLEVSTDGNKWESTWQTVGDTIIIKESPRLTHNITRSYEGTDEVYVRAYLANNNSKVGFYDIYIANAGEKSTGISEQKAEPAKKVAGIYNLNGVRQNALRRGLNIVVDESGKAKKVLVK